MPSPRRLARSLFNSLLDGGLPNEVFQTRLRTVAALNRRSGVPGAKLILLFGIAAAAFLPALTRVIAGSPATARAENRKGKTLNPVQLSERRSTRTTGRGDPTINLSDGPALLGSYTGPEDLQQALAQNQAQPLSLASADFDEDGIPDLISGYGYAGRGIVTLRRGNVDAIYPNAPEAQRRRATGDFTEAPFLSPARVFATPLAADFIGAGDFDGDGHWDVVVASRNSDKLVLLSGDGAGGFAQPKEIELSGRLTAFVTGEINRPDGLTDIVCGVAGPEGPKVLIFEGPEGALRVKPEELSLSEAATSLALGQLDDEPEMDLVVAAGRDLVLIHGRDRKLSLDLEQRAAVIAAKIERRSFSAAIRSVAIGNFARRQLSDIALLSDDGAVQLIGRENGTGKERKAGPDRKSLSLSKWCAETISVGRWPEATVLVRARISNLPTDTLLVVDPDTGQLQMLTKGTSGTDAAHNDDVSKAGESQHQLTTLSIPDGGPVAVLPMRLHSDALSDLVILPREQSAPTVIHSAPTTTFVVNSAADTDDGVCNPANCTLREAISAANANPGADTITFNIGTGPQTIITTSPLPALNAEAVTVDGTTQPGFSGDPIIELRDELTMYSSNSLVRGLVVRGINLKSLESSPASGNTIEGNYVGGDIRIIGPRNNVIGGTTPQARNTIGAVEVDIGPAGSNGSGNVIQGNYIDRLSIFSGSNLTIGGSSAGTRNFINSGVFVSELSGALIQGNLIGTDVTGTKRLGAGRISLSANFSVTGIHAVTIGGTTTGLGNLISDGISLAYEAVSGNQIQGNYIGVDSTGAVALGNSGDGVRFDLGAHRNTVGGDLAGARNIISGNAGSGIGFGNAPGDETPNYVEGNFIGTDATGTKALGNAGSGVRIPADGHAAASIGGSTPETGNVISNNGGHGIFMSGSGAPVSNVSIQNNYIGSDISGRLDMGNAHDGVFIGSGCNQVVTRNNLVAFNHDNGVNIPGTDSSAAIRNAITSNSIYANGALGINLGDPGITANDYQDADIGANNLQNFPILTTAVLLNSSRTPTEKDDHDLSAAQVSLSGTSGLTINGTLNSTPNKTFAVHWYFSGNSQCSNNQQETRQLSSGAVPWITTDANGDAAFSFPFAWPTGVTSGVLNATATDPDGNTSEFSLCFPVTSCSISGRVTVEGNGLAGVTATLNGATGTTLTDSAGYYSFTDLMPGQNYTVTPSKTNYTFSPVSMVVNNLTGNQTADFNAVLKAMQFDAAGYSVSEGSTLVTVTIVRSGDKSAPATIDYATADGTAEQRSDYMTTAGTLSFRPGENSRSFDVLIVDDRYVEGDETLSLSLSNPTGGALTGPSTVTLTILDNDHQSSQTNPLDDPDAQFFVREHYSDFLSRAPDTDGLRFWSGMIAQCGADQGCLRTKRIDVSNAFFQEREYQQTGAYVFRLYRVAFGNNQPFANPFADPNHLNEEKKLPSYAAFSVDRSRVIGGADLSQGQLDLANAFVQRGAFVARYPASLATAEQFVDALLATIQNDMGVDLNSQRNNLIALYNSGGRGAVIYRLADDNTQGNPINNRALIDAEYNRAFVATQYFGYLRRDADIGGFLFWLGQVSSAAPRDLAREHAMVCSFVTSTEYQQRFSPVAPHSNVECQP